MHRARIDPDTGYEYCALCYHPIVIVTLCQEGLKQRLCNALKREGFTVLPSHDDSEYLVRGHSKTIPTEDFVRALRRARVEYIRLISYGVKMDATEFDDTEDILLK